MNDSARALRAALLNRAWIQWVALGVDAVQEADHAVVDPEALVALTAEIGASDIRLLDVSSDWCVAYGTYVNASRLKRVAREMQSPIRQLGEFAATVAVAGGPHWSMATEPRSDYTYRRKARLEFGAAKSQASNPAARRVRSQCPRRHSCSSALPLTRGDSHCRSRPNNAILQGERDSCGRRARPGWACQGEVDR